MSFTYDPTTDRGKVRLLVADTDTTNADLQVFSDAEIDGFLALEGGEVYGAAAAACESLAASTSRSAIRMKLEKLLEIDRKDVPQHFRLLAEAHRKRMMGTPVELIDSFDFRTSDFGEDESEYVGDIV